jgi:hypothetical protein
MKNKPCVFLIILALGFSFVACDSTPRVDKLTSESAPGASAQPVIPFYTGSGGKGISIAILAPKPAGLTENQAYIPSLVQGEFVSNFSGYSAISVLDRENLDEQYGELSSGYYDDDAETGVDLGHLPPTEYIMGGKITKTAAGYALQIQITKTADKMIAASYSGTCTFAELDNLTGIRQASLDLLQKIGVELTDRAKTELTGAAAANRVNAQTALAQGITAQQGGTVVEALSYYYQAAAFDPSLLEAANRASVMSADISSGNIGANVRNDIQRRKEWQKILDEAENYFLKHLPFEIVYDPALTQGKVDYQRETINLSTFVSLKALKESFKVFDSITKGLESTGKRREWGFGFWPVSSRLFSDQYYAKETTAFTSARESIDLEIGLFNDRSVCISKADIELWGEVHFARGTKMEGRNYDYGYVISVMGDHYSVDTTKLEFVPRIDRYYGYGEIPGGNPVEFRDVNANDITENMKVKIISINSIDAERAVSEAYIRITAGNITPREWADIFKRL